MTAQFPHLFSPLTLRGVTIRNRILFSAHGTRMAKGAPGDALIAYHTARAAGGAGLIVTEVAIVHESAYYTENCLNAATDACIPGYRRLAAAVHGHGCKLFGQLFHPGRQVLGSADGSIAVAYGPSAIPEERYHVMPRAMSTALVREVIAAHGTAARRLAEAGLDGVEIVASHGYLLAQFLNPKVNRRTDDYGGDFESRVRFVREIVAAIRRDAPDMVIGLRISGDERDPNGLGDEEALAVCVALDEPDGVDYMSVVAGTAASLGGSVHIVPTMALTAGYTAPYAAAVKARVSKPVMVAGRINQPQVAERILAAGDADMCAMTRAMICDPAIAGKAAAGRLDDIRACIACNQACIGHNQRGYSVTCIQHPETGRELAFGTLEPADEPRRILVAGGGPGGMKAAAVAAERGHALLAQLLPGRAEFGGIVTNLAREMELAGVRVVTGTEVTRALVEHEAPDAVILATGATPYRPRIEGQEEGHVVDAWSVIRGEANVGGSVVIADWRCDWIGLGLAEKLARDGCRVRLCANGNYPGQTIQQYVRDQSLAELHRLGVEIIPLARLHGVDGDTAYFQHSTGGEAILLEDVETVVAALGHTPDVALEESLEGYPGVVIPIGDCLAPRTAEEAVLEGLKAGVAV
jgi:2,4-dienoyl-CoA reductase-like NADH-dependent reductase (Old Yellow Enzyme family)/thioredoxin reductase